MGKVYSDSEVVGMLASNDQEPSLPKTYSDDEVMQMMSEPPPEKPW